MKIALLLFSLVLGFTTEAQSVGRTNIQTSVTLAWSASPSSGLAGYRLYSGGATRSYTNVVTMPLVTTATLTNFVRGSTYYFSVTCYTTNGLESDYSNEAVWTSPALPVAPSITITGSQ